MATLAEVLAESSTTEYTYVDGYEVNTKYVDENVVEISDREIGDVVANVSTFGENKSQAITFRVSRYYDGIDITETGKLLKVHYQLADETGSDDAPINVKRNDTHVIFTWVIPAAATVEAATIHFIVYVIGDDYIWKTLSKPYVINDTLEIGGGLPEPDTNWYTDFVRQMEAYVAQCAGASTSASEAKASATEAKTSAEEAEASAASIKGDVEASAANATAAANSATAAKTSETNAKASEDDVAANASSAKASETNAKASETAAKTSETNAATSETNAKASETAAKTSETNAKTSESNANSLEIASGLNATSAANSASAAKASETNAKTSEVNADASAKAAAQSASSVQGVKYSKSQWYLSTSATEETGGEWVDTMPELTAGKYLWNRTFTDYSDGSSTTSVAVVVTGIDALRDAIANEVSRAQTAEEANATAIQNEVTRAKAAEEAEATRAQTAEQANATAVTTEENRAKAAEEANATAITNEATRATAAENTKQNKASKVTATMAATNWSSKTYSFESAYPKASYDIEIEPAPTITSDQLDAWSGAKIVGSSDSNIVTAIGDVPTVDIPIIVKVVAL